jgi:molecular chaperone GrpE
LSDETPPGGVPRPGDEVVEPLAAPSEAPPALAEQRAKAAEQRLAEVIAAYRQLKQENEGYRERLTRDIERRYERKREQLLIGFIETLDNFERALEMAQPSGAAAFVEGLILVRTNLVQILQEQGLTWIPVRGLPYDPECSEAVDMEDVEDPAHDQVVIRELQRGYRLNGRIVRHARVVVGQYRAPREAAEAAPEAAPEAVAQTPVIPDTEVPIEVIPEPDPETKPGNGE